MSAQAVETMKRWQTTACDREAATALAAATELPLAACLILLQRGCTDAASVQEWLAPRLSRVSDPFLLPDMERAVQRLSAALEKQEPILVYGDYDVDGITSTALMIRVLTALGGQAVPFLPHRVDDGYGLGVDPVQRCIADCRPGCIVTVDCGTGSVEAVEAARAAGVDVVITDHHEPGERVAAACAVVNPKLGAPHDPLRNLAGVGVAFKLCHALLKRLRTAGYPAVDAVDLRQVLDLVAVGTIADMVPLIDENRVLSRYGLAELNRTTKPGLLALKEVAGIKGPVDAYHIGFLLGPRLNAAGRLGTARSALRLLLTADEDEAGQLAAELDAANRDRQQIEARMVEQAMESIDATYDAATNFGVVAAHRDWHPGVIGIVASRLCARYSRPAIVIAVDEEGIGRGSCRSIGPFHMVEGLTACAEHLTRFGGHAMAAGLQLPEDRIDAFREQFNQAVKARLSSDQLRPEQRVDAWISLREADWPLMECLEQMAPFGQGNTKPVWAVESATLLGAPRVVGQRHLKMTVLQDNQKLDAIAFNMADREVPDGPLDIAFQLSRNSFAGRESIQMNVQDFRPSTVANR
jgi:single-stranded-DNA-specific exonuclease